MKRLRVFKKNETEGYETGSKASTYPQEVVKDIIYENGNFTVVFFHYKKWFKTFVNLPCEYLEYEE